MSPDTDSTIVLPIWNYTALRFSYCDTQSYDIVKSGSKTNVSKEYMKVACSSEMLLPNYSATRCHSSQQVNVYMSNNVAYIMRMKDSRLVFCILWPNMKASPKGKELKMSDVESFWTGRSITCPRCWQYMALMIFGNANYKQLSHW
jgi:hypothetical protein